MQFTNESSSPPYPTPVLREDGCAGSTAVCPDRDAVKSFLELYRAEVMPVGLLSRRLEEVRAQLAHYGRYRQTTEEMAYGAKLAWRNNADA
jgi:nitric-oxide synthase